MALLITPVGVLSFPALFTPRARAEGKEPDYSATLIFPPAAQKDPQFKVLKQAVEALLKEKFPKAKREDLTLPFRDGGDKEDKYPDTFHDGDIYIAPWSKHRPKIVDRHRNFIDDPEDVWAGQTARLQVNPFSWTKSGKMGVSFGLSNVQIISSKGSRLDGRMSADKAFEDAPPLADDEDDDDDTPF